MFFKKLKCLTEAMWRVIIRLSKKKQKTKQNKKEQQVDKQL